MANIEKCECGHVPLPGVEKLYGTVENPTTCYCIRCWVIKFGAMKEYVPLPERLAREIDRIMISDMDRMIDG